VETVEITREDIYVTVEETAARENRGRKCSRPSPRYPLHRIYVLSGREKYIYIYVRKMYIHIVERNPAASTSHQSVPSRSASIALFYLSRGPLMRERKKERKREGERVSFELPSLTPGSPDITSIVSFDHSPPFGLSAAAAQSNPRHRPLSKNFPPASLAKEGRKNSNPFRFSYLVGQKGLPDRAWRIPFTLFRTVDRRISRFDLSRRVGGPHDSRRPDARRIFDCVRSPVKRVLNRPN